MTSDERHAVYEAVAEHLPAVIREEWNGRLDYCILATNVGIRLLKSLGIRDVEPLSVGLTVMNPICRDAVEDGSFFSDDEAVQLALKERGGHFVQIDVKTQNVGRFAGHVAMWLPDDEVLLDATLGQASRPAKQIVLPDGACFSGATRGWVEAEQQPLLYDINGAAVIYHPMPNEGFRKAPDWKRPYHDVLAAALLRVERSIREPVAQS